MQTTIRHFQSTSLESYRILVETAKLEGQILEYLDLLRLHIDTGLTDGHAALLLGWPRSTVSARRNDVAKVVGKHLVINIPGERRKNPGRGSKSALVWRLNI